VVEDLMTCTRQAQHGTAVLSVMFSFRENQVLDYLVF